MRAERRKWRAGLTAAIAALALAGCSLGDPDGAQATGNGDGAGDESNGGTHTFVAGTGTVPHLNPQIIVSPSVNTVAGSILEQLTKLSDTFEVQPWLARDWEVSDDGLTVTLYLEEGVTWHDGEPFTSEDVAFNFEEVMMYQSYGGALVERIESIALPDDHTVEVTLNAPYGPFMEVLTLQYLLPKHLYEGTDIIDNPTNMEQVGTGPFMLERFSEGQEITMTSNPDYWRGDVPVDRLIFTIQNDTNAGALALLAGETMVGGAGQGMLDQMWAAEHLELTQRGQLPRQFVFTMNADVPELADAEIRKLVYQSIDRTQVAEVAMPEISYEASSIYPDELAWLDTDVDLREEFPYDPDAINAALDEAGYPRGEDGIRFSLRLHLMGITAEARAVGAVISDSMSEVGIDVDLTGEDTSVFMENVYERRDFDMAIVEATLGVDPSLGITRWYECNPEKAQAQNPSGLCDEALQEAADLALSTADQEERAEHLAEVEQRALDVMMSAPLVFHTVYTVYNHDQWDGLENSEGLVGRDWTTVFPTS